MDDWLEMWKLATRWEGRSPGFVPFSSVICKMDTRVRDLVVFARITKVSFT